MQRRVDLGSSKVYQVMRGPEGGRDAARKMSMKRMTGCMKQMAAPGTFKKRMWYLLSGAKLNLWLLSN